MTDTQLYGSEPGAPLARSHSAHPPMDLVCERVSRWTPRRRIGDQPVMSREADARIRLPNPRYPMPPQPITRLHCADGFHAARGWGQASHDALDVALNVMAAYLPFRISDRLGALRVTDGAIVSRQAARLYEAFCEEFLVQMPAEGAVISEATIREWIRERECAADAAAGLAA